LIFLLHVELLRTFIRHSVTFGQSAELVNKNACRLSWMY